MTPNEWNAAIRELEDQRNIGFSRAANAAVREAKLAAESAELRRTVEALEAKLAAMADSVQAARARFSGKAAAVADEKEAAE